MKQATLLKSIHKYFKNYDNVQFDTNASINFNGPFISLKYMPQKNTKNLYGIKDIKKTKGVLRIFIYEENPTKCLEKMDNLVADLDQKTKEGVLYTLGNSFQSCQRYNNSELFETFLDFNVCLTI